MMAARYRRLPKSETPGTIATSEGFCAVTTTGSGEAFGAILAPILTPCTRHLHVQRLGAVHDFTPCSCPARCCRRRPLERDPAEVAPENAKSGNLGGGVHRP